ncbi:hypothetical protein Tco_0496482 [Tanacetum coccineum]
MNWGEVNPVHAYYNGSCTSKDNEDPSWSTSFKTRRTSKTSSALEALWKTLFMLYLYKIGTLLKSFIKIFTENIKASIPSVERPWLSEAEGFILSNHDTGRILPAESQRNSTDPSVDVIDSSETEYDSVAKSSVCSTFFPPVEKPGDAELVYGPKTVKTTLKSISTFQAKYLKGIIPNEPSSAPTQENKKASALKSNSAPAENSKNVKSTDYLHLATHLSSMGRSSRSKNPRPSKCFIPPCTHCGSMDHLSDDCLYYPICRICGSYDHETNGHNRIISLEREIYLRNPQHPFKRCKVCGSSIHTTIDHYDIEWFKRGEALQAKRAEDQKRTMLPNANRSKTPTKWKAFTRSLVQYKEYLSEFWYSANALDNSKVSLSIPTGGIYEVLELNTFRKAIGAHYLSHSSDYVDPPSIDIRLLMAQIIQCLGGKTGGVDQITNKDTIILKIKIKLVAFKSPRTSSQTEKKVSQDTKPGAKDGHTKQLTFSKQPHMFSSEATKGGSSKAPISSKTGPSRKRKESSSAKDSNPSQPSISTSVDTGMHKEDQQAASGPTSLGVTSEEGAHPQLSSAEADLGTSAPNDFLPPQQGKDEGTKNYLLDHIFTGTDPNVLADKTKYVSDGLETILTTPKTGTKNAAKPSEEINFEEIKLEDLAKLVPNVKADFKDLDSPEDDPIIVVDDSEEDEEENKNKEIHSTQMIKLKTFQLPYLHLQETKKTKAEAEIARLKAQYPSPNVGQLNELLVKSLTAEFLKILSAHDFHSLLSTELKELPSKFNELTNEVKALKTQVHGLKIEVLGDLKELPTKLENLQRLSPVLYLKLLN